MSHSIDSKTPFHGEAIGEQVWENSITKEYQYILKNDERDIVLRPKGKYMVTFKWIYENQA
jgi:hypothetical protein